MKRRGWHAYLPWEYEKTGEIVVFTMDNKTNKQKPTVIKEIEELHKEFSIPLHVFDSDLKETEDLLRIKGIFHASIEDSKLDYEVFEKELRKVRDKGRLPYGVVLLVNRNEYEFCDPPGYRDKAIYGIGIDDGLVILRHTHKESVRHEVGHMLGLGHHHPQRPGCIMNWVCDIDIFCSDCRRQIQEMWQEEIHSKNNPRPFQ